MGAKSTGNFPTTTKADGHLLDYFRSGFGAGGGASAAAETGLSATGGVISDYTSGSNVYRAHIFTSSGTFAVTQIGSFPADVEYLVVAGGGGGGGASGGGGGAGGFRTNLSGHPLAGSSYGVSVGSYTVTVGAGGDGSPGASPWAGTQGANSEFYPAPVSHPSPTRIRADGGGLGRGGGNDGSTGGSGAGGDYNNGSV